MPHSRTQERRPVTIVTGAAGGIGAVLAESLARQGHRVWTADIRPQTPPVPPTPPSHQGEVAVGATATATATATPPPPPPLPVQHRLVDITDAQQLRRFFDEVVGTAGRVDNLVNNAATAANGDFAELTMEAWQRVLATNLTAPMMLSQWCAAVMRDSRPATGAIVNICSTRALMSEAGTEAYSASKGGLLALTHSLAMSLSPAIRVNAVSPGWIHHSGADALRSQDHDQHPSGRVGTPMDVVRAVQFLIDPENSFVTGQNLVIDGGMTKKMIYF